MKQRLKTDDPNTILATRKYVDDAVKKVREKSAPIDSPTFIGTPNAPTPEQDNNSEQLATTAFVQTLGQRLIPDMRDGYQVLSSGLIFQWGSIHTPAESLWVMFPIAFSDDSFQVFLTDRGGLGCNPGAAVHGTNNFTGFRAYGKSISSHNFSPTGFAWFAIGR